MATPERGRKLLRMLWPAALLATAACVDTGTPDRTEVRTGTDTAGESGVPIRLAGPGGAALLVPVRVNGEGPFDFVLDTGATLTCVDQGLADSLGLPPATGARGIGAGVRGEAGAIRLVDIDSLAVGDARAEGLTGCVLDLAQVRSIGVDAHGLLGLNFLQAFRVTLDFQKDRLTLSEP